MNFMSANAFFSNIDNEDFEVFWNGKKRTFKSGEVKLLPEWFAAHCAKHLTNKILLKSGDPKDENYTSPKRIEDVPRFKSIYDKCYKLHGTTQEAEKKDALDAEIELLNAAQGGPNVPDAEEKPKEEAKKEEEEEFTE